MKTGITSNTPNNMLLGPGVVYRGFSNPSTPGTLVGATIGGAAFSVSREYYVPELDGAMGPVKGTRVLVSEVAAIKVTMAEMTKANFLLALAGTSAADYSSPATHDKITSGGAISAGNYQDIAVVADKAGTTTPFCFVTKNAMATDLAEVKLGTGKNSTPGLEVTFTAHYLADSPGTPPWEIYSPK